MARRAPTLGTLRALFAKSGNQCAFPDCAHEMIKEKNLYVGVVCHIEAASPNGPRYNSAQTDEERRSYDNLILLCYAHHKVVDTDRTTYTASKLREIKAAHEEQLKRVFQIDERTLREIALEMEAFWDRVERLNKFEHVRLSDAPELAMSIDTKMLWSDLMNAMRALLGSLKGDLDELFASDSQLADDAWKMLKQLGYDTTPYENQHYTENPFENRNWFIHNILIPNTYTTFDILLCHLELKFLEQYLTLHPTDSDARAKLEERRKELDKLARTAEYID